MRYFIDLSYHGKYFHGWQIQPDVRTVQETVNEGLSKLLRQTIEIVGAGRTDAGVHAEIMMAHFDCDTSISEKDITGRLNAFLPEDIVVHKIYRVINEAHARFDAIYRAYEYRIYLGRNAFLNDTTWQLFNQQLDVNKMNECAAILLEYTNFKCFSKTHTDVKTYTCNVVNAEWKRRGDQLIFSIRADRFLRNMVRAIVGTLVDVGLGKITKEDFKCILKSEDRSQAGVSVPARGLFLVEVTYPENLIMNNK